MKSTKSQSVLEIEKRWKEDPRSDYWKKKADALWGKLIHLDGACAMVGYANHKCAGNLEAHHIITRERSGIRHHPMNGILLCSSGHKYSRDLSPHMAPFAFFSFLQETRPEQFAWAKANRFFTGKPDYKQAYERIAVLIESRKGTGK